MSLHCSCVTETYGSTKTLWAKVGQTPVGWINSRHDDCVVFRPNNCPLANKSTPPVATGQATEWRWPSEDGNSPKNAGLKKKKKTTGPNMGSPPCHHFLRMATCNYLGLYLGNLQEFGTEVCPNVDYPVRARQSPLQSSCPVFIGLRWYWKPAREGFCRWHWANYDMFIFFWSLHFWKASNKSLKCLRFQSPPARCYRNVHQTQVGKIESWVQLTTVSCWSVFGNA